MNYTIIKSFRDLLVYKSSYELCIFLAQNIIPKLPKEEDYDLKDQLRRSSKAIPRLIAEGYAKRHQKLGFHKYLDDAMAETNETIVGLEQIRDIYGSLFDIKIIDDKIDAYDKIGRQLFLLRKSWKSFADERR